MSNSIKLLVPFLWLILRIIYVETNHKKNPDLIYVLLWTDSGREPFSFWSKKRESLILMNCPHQNCYLTSNREFFEDQSDYDVILFNSVNVFFGHDLPIARSDNQMYIFVSLESFRNYPMPDMFNYFFNYTWTYKLDSDIMYPYFIVRNKRGGVIAPKKRVHWMNPKFMRPAEESVITKLRNKSIAAAWFVSNCAASSARLQYNREVRMAFDKFGHAVDVFGICDANKKCGRDKMDDCLAMIESQYYFYFAFENSVCKDYVTEKVMSAIDHYMVPVVYGGANYSRFLPDGSYLNANEYEPAELAKKMHEIIEDKQKYYDFFRFHRYYTFQYVEESVDTNPLCAFCAFLNDESRRNKRQTYAKFTDWWNNQHNDTDEIVVKYGDSEPHIKAVMTYSYRGKEQGDTATPSVIDSVNNLFNDIIGYYFDS